MAEVTTTTPAPRTDAVVYYKEKMDSLYENRIDRGNSSMNGELFSTIYNKDVDAFGKVIDSWRKYGSIDNALKMKLKNNEFIDVAQTAKNLGIVDTNFTPIEYVVSMLEKIHANYKPGDEEQKNDITNLWEILNKIVNKYRYYKIPEYMTTDQEIIAERTERLKKRNKQLTDEIIDVKSFQNFLRKIKGDYASIDEVIGKDVKLKFIDENFVKTMSEKANERFGSAKQGFSSFFGKKDAAPVTTAPTGEATVTTDAASAPTGEATVTTDAASAPTGEAPAKKGFLSGISNPFGKKDTTEKKGWFSGGRKSRKQGKSKKQRKSRKQRKTRK